MATEIAVMEIENNILVVYIGVQGIRSEDIEDFIKRVSRKIIPSTFLGEVIVIPTHSPDTRIECINPQYVTDEELVQKHNELMKEINSELQYQLKLLSEENKKIKDKLKSIEENGEKKSGD